MRRRAKQYEITEAVRGSFVGAAGRIHYDVQPGPASAKDVAPEALALLLRAGFAVDADAPMTEAESDSAPDEAPEPAGSEERA